MKTLFKYGTCASLLAMLMLPVPPVHAEAFVQCPGDTDGDAVPDDGITRYKTDGQGNQILDENGQPIPRDIKCMHLSSGDGYTNMADGRLQYAFGFGELTGVPLEDSHDVGILNAMFTAPTIELDQGEEFYLSLSNTGMVDRPDLFDSHTVHFHGFPNASSVFDGVPDASISINMGATLTYYYNIVEPGTYLYHCHVEAAEHMQMGMQGNLYVHPAQDGTSVEFPVGSGKFYDKFAYNDIDNYGQAGSTGYDVEFPLMLTGFDPVFHDASMNTQPLPFAEMNDTYHMFNGRGYPATVQPNEYYETNPGAAQATIAERISSMVNDQAVLDGYKQNFNSQPYSSKMDSKGTDSLGNPVPIVQGDRILLRITNLSIIKFHTITALGLPMQVIGQGGRELEDKYFANSVNLGGGESFDVMIDTSDVAPGTYYVYTTELHQLSNDDQSFGGAMTEIVIAAAE